MIRLVAYLVGVASMGSIAQGTVGTSLHDALWRTQVRMVQGESRIVTQTTTLPGTTPRTRAADASEPVPTTTIFVTVPGRTTTTTVPGRPVPAGSTTETVGGPGATVTTTVPGPTTTVAGPTTTVAVAGPTTTTTVPGPTRTTTVTGATETTTVPGPTETQTETVTMTVTEACDPPPKKPSNPPCPPHK